MKWKPDAADLQSRINTKDMPDLGPGIHTVQIASYSEDVNTDRFSGDIVEFCNASGRISEYIDERTTWKFARLAKALGPQATTKAKEVDANGYSLFSPGDFIGSCVSIEVEEYAKQNGGTGTRIKRVNLLNPESGDPQEDIEQPFVSSATASVPDDDIPF